MTSLRTFHICTIIMIDIPKIRFAQLAAVAITIIAFSATRSHASTLIAPHHDIDHAQVFSINLENAHHGHGRGAVQFDANKIFDVAIDVAGAVHWSNSTSIVQSIGILLPAYYLDLPEFLDLSPFEADGSISRLTAAIALGMATVNCASVNSTTLVINEEYSVGISECSASNYWIPHTRAASKFVFGGVFETKANIRDSSVVGRAILAATTFAGGATTVSVGHLSSARAHLA
jgi:hypothetical protein